ncbi:MAG: phosphatase domain-containing protein [Saprospiraceae bacterium]
MSKIKIQTYTAFATSSHIYIKGRVLEDKSPISAPQQNMVSALYNMVLRSSSNEKPNVNLTIYIGDYAQVVESDKEGYFELFEQIQYKIDFQNAVRITGKIKQEEISTDLKLQFYNNCQYGVISDIDDTILVTGVKSWFKIKLVLNTLLLNPFRRKQIKSAAKFFTKLSIIKSVKHNADKVPIIYLSNSPWNIYDYLTLFLNHNKFPNGQVILRDMGWHIFSYKKIEDYNKYIEIERLLIAFPSTPFYLIGDTGEKDFDIYMAILQKHPTRIEKIIMNKVGNKVLEKKINTKINQNDSNLTLIKGYSKLL